METVTLEYAQKFLEEVEKTKKILREHGREVIIWALIDDDELVFAFDDKAHIFKIVD